MPPSLFRFCAVGIVAAGFIDSMTNLKFVVELDTPIQRALQSGWKGTSSIDLLAIALHREGAQDDDASIRAMELLRSMGKVHSFADLSVDQLRTASGCDAEAAYRILAWLELGRRSANAGKGPQQLVMSPSDVAHMLRHLQHEKREHFVIVLLDAKNALMKWTTIHIGTLTMSVVGPREVFREAIREGAAGIILAHNHPSGDPEPSPEDVSITQKLSELGEVLDIKVWDHIIVGGRDWVSLRQLGAFDSDK